jgi:site-specific DNA-methyltransferase (adenine-specific)
MFVLNTSALDIDLDVIASEPPDVMIVDPPYRAHVHKSAVSQSVGGGSRSRDLGFESLSVALRHRIARFAALTKRWSIIYTDLESMTWWRLSLQAAGATYIRAIPWVRWSMPQLSGDRPTTGCEMLVVAYGCGKGRKHWNGPGNLLSLTHTCLRGEGKHKTEKPLDQLLDLVSYFSDPGETVFDPCAGSGTTGLACKILERQFVGLEIQPEWVTFANARMANVNMLSERDQTRLEKWRVSQKAQAADKERLREHTAKIRAKADVAKAKETSDESSKDVSSSVTK